MKNAEKIMDIPIEKIKPFQNHPFGIRQDEEMDALLDSARQFGIITPGLARPLENGGYELVSGHRRLAACEALRLETMPIIVRDMSDDEAVINMVDSNLQREHIFPSEKAFAYKMKLEAQNRQGQRTDLTSCQVGTKLENEDSKRQVYRYIRLTYLIPELLQMVDEEKIAFTPAVELSYLTKEEHQHLYQTIESEECTPSLSQAQRMKRLSQDGILTPDKIFQTMRELKPNQKEKLSFKTDDLRGYFPKTYTPQQMQDTILKLLDNWRKRQRDKGSR